MSTNSISAPGAFPRSSPAPMSGLSQDRGTLELGIESAWTRDKTFATGVERSDSLRAEPPTSDQLSMNSLMGALGAPSDYNSPPVSRTGSDLLEAPLIVSEDSGGSVMMSISPLLESVVGQRYSHLEQPLASMVVPKSHDHGRRSPRPSEKLTWSDLPNDNQLGEVPEFLLLSPLIDPHSVKSSPRIPYESKGKLPEPKENNTDEKPDPNEWYHDWTTSGDELPNDIGTNHNKLQPSTSNKHLRSRRSSASLKAAIRSRPPKQTSDNLDPPRKTLPRMRNHGSEGAGWTEQAWLQLVRCTPYQIPGVPANFRGQELRPELPEDRGQSPVVGGSGPEDRGQSPVIGGSGPEDPD
ncbi:hypothetical protein DFH29DRAFT_878446 [Suillus ampliporus]|nr:hypothetical protein DFH29DRAFT_878446 [Suillus ampliporus]